jgi:hypothetical protein
MPLALVALLVRLVLGLVLAVLVRVALFILRSFTNEQIRNR